MVPVPKDAQHGCSGLAGLPHPSPAVQHLKAVKHLSPKDLSFLKPEVLQRVRRGKQGRRNLLVDCKRCI